MEDSLNLELALLKSTFNAEHFVRGLSWFIPSNSAQFTLEMYVTALRGVPLYDAFVRGKSPHSAARNLLARNSLAYHVVKTRSLYFTWAWLGTGLSQTDKQTDRRTDGRTDRITIASTLSAVRAVARKSRPTPKLLRCTENHCKFVKNQLEK